MIQPKIPNPREAFLSLIRADFTTQWRNRRAVVMSILVPAVILVSWKGLVSKVGGPFVISISLTIGLTSIGLMGYAISVARDRDKGIFQRLRATPTPNFFIMISRLTVQLVMILLLVACVFIVGYRFDHIALSPGGYALTFATGIVGGALYLGLGQTIVGFVKNAETVSSTTRLVYIAFLMLGMFGELNQFPAPINRMVHWSPFGTVRMLLTGSMDPGLWTQDTTIALFISAAYAVVFCFLGIKWFKWNAAGA